MPSATCSGGSRCSRLLPFVGRGFVYPMLGHILNTPEVPLAVDVGQYRVNHRLPSALMIHWARLLFIATPVAASNVNAVGQPKAIGLSAACDCGLHCRRAMWALYVVEVKVSAHVREVSFHRCNLLPNDLKRERTWPNMHLCGILPTHDRSSRRIAAGPLGAI